MSFLCVAETVELTCSVDKLVLHADRDRPTMISLQPPANLETESKSE